MELQKQTLNKKGGAWRNLERCSDVRPICPTGESLLREIYIRIISIFAEKKTLGLELEFTQASVSKIYTARLKSMHLLIAASAKNSQGCRVPVADRILMIFVYRCDVIPFDMTGNNNDTGGPIDEKSYQWFGASISSSGDDGVIVVRLSFLLGKKF